MSTVLRSSQAEVDLEEIWGYVAQDNPVAADRLLERIDEMCRKLADFPRMGQRRSDLAPDIRVFPVGKYVVFYRPIKDGIEVARVVSGARDFETLF